MKNTEFLKPEQLRAINHDDGDILVSASAGSGKTFVMIRRLIRLIAEGKADVSEILAATFTEAAAADMKEKLKKALSDEIENGAERLAAQLSRVDSADICTLHGFCGRLIRTYFFAAGVAPDFSVADASDADALKAESMEETFAAFYAEKNPDFLKLIDRFRARRKDDAFRDVISAIYEYCNSETDADKFLRSYERNFTADGARKFREEYDVILKSAVLTVKDRLVKIGDAFMKTGYDAGVKNCSEFIAVADGILSGGAERARQLCETGLPDITRTKPAANAESAKEDLKKQKTRLKALCEFSRDAKISDDGIAGLYESGRALESVVKKYAEIYARKKRENNLLDFNDLEKFALIALKDADVARAVRKKYKYVFVDEYQDVNDVQEAIISAIKGGNLFMVGDVKQSIYGFRGCRAEIFENKEKTVAAAGGSVVGLNSNFRSADNVIDLVNEIFDFCYVQKYTGLDYRATSRLKSGGVYPENAKGRAELHFLVKPKAEKTEKPEPRLYDILREAFKEEEKETTSVSNLVAEIINAELSKQYYDVKSRTFKPVTMHDIAVLTRAGDSGYVRGLTEGLVAHGIRVVSGVSQNVCDFPEIKTLINVLKLADNFRQDAPLASTLLSPIGSFTEEDLAEIALFAADGGKRACFSDAFAYYAENAETPLKTRIVRFKEYFDGLRFLAEFKGAKGVLDKAIADCGYENCLLAEKDGEVKVRRLYKFLSETRSGGRTYTTAEFLKRIDVAREAFEFSDGGEEDAVRVMTVHSSKGLEFPVVIVCGLEKAFNRADERKTVLFDRNRGFFPYSYDDKARTAESNGYRAVIKAVQRETQIKEEMRLFYVAATRAAYSLHLVFEKQSDTRTDEFSQIFTETASFSDFVPSSVKATVHLPERFGLSAERREKRDVIIVRPDGERAERMAKDYSFVYPYLAAVSAPLKNSVTSLVKNGSEEVYPARVIYDGEFDTERGTIAHKILESYDFGGDLYRHIKRLISDGVLTEEQIKKVDTEKIRLAVDGGAFDGLRGKKLFREQPFIVNVPARVAIGADTDEEILVQGVIDLLAVDGGKADIIDYKYSSHGGEALKKAYAGQLNLYAYAAERALGLKVVSKTVVNVFTGEQVNLD